MWQSPSAGTRGDEHLPVPPPSIISSPEGGKEENRKSPGWKKEIAKVTGSGWKQSRRELKGRLKIAPARWEVGGGGCWGGHGDRLGCGEGWEGRGHGLGKEGEELDWERLGSWEHIWMGEPRVTVRTAGLGATAGWVALGCQWEQMEGGDGGTSGWESPGMAMGTAGGGQWGAHLGGRAPGSR